MILTEYQQEMLDGRYGKGKSMAAEILVAIGESFDAERMVPVSAAHVSLSAQDADIWFAEKMRDAGAACAVRPTVNPGYDAAYFRKKGMLRKNAEETMRRCHEAYRALGATMTYSCTPYLFGNIPKYGDTVAFSETSVTIYANSVIGARTNRESAASALCAAITGFTPEYGMLLPENRLANVLVEVDADMKDPFDYAMLGLTGAKIGKGIPCFTGLPGSIRTEELIRLGSELNVSGSTERYLIPGVTPDAGTIEEAFGRREPDRIVRITREDMREALEHYSPTNGKPEYAILGCPHYTYDQILAIEDGLEGRRSRIPVWILTSSAVLNLAREGGVAERLEQQNVDLVAATCVDEVCCWESLKGKCGITDSPKAAYYMRTFGVTMQVRSQGTVLEAMNRE